MHILILSDIHANLTALNAVLATPEAESCDQLWSLGDAVGYGPNPNECVALLQERATVALVGNHDLAAIGKVAVDEFNPHARYSLLWTAGELTTQSRAWLHGLSAINNDWHPHCTLCHASPRDPIWEYITDVETASANFPHFDSRFALVGHTHRAAIFRASGDSLVAGFYPVPGHQLALNNEPLLRYILNPGSVGQPRDQDPRASFAIFDDDALTITYHRAEYDIAATQQAMRAANLPEKLIRRLEIGW